MKNAATIRAFTHDTYTGSRSNLTIESGTQVRDVGVDINDPLDGEPVVWFEARLNGVWTKVGARGLPVLTRGWKSRVFGTTPTKRERHEVRLTD